MTIDKKQRPFNKNGDITKSFNSYKIVLENDGDVEMRYGVKTDDDRLSSDVLKINKQTENHKNIFDVPRIQTKKDCSRF